MALTTDRTHDWSTPQPATGPPDGPTRRGYIIAVIIAAAVLIAGFGGGLALTHHNSATTTAGTHVTTPATKTTTPAAGTPTTAAGTTGGTSIPAAQPNPPSLAGAYSTDPITVLRTLSAYSDWLFSHPNPALLANYMLPACRNYNAVMQELELMVKNNWHAIPSVSEIQWAKVTIPFTPAPGLLDGHPAYVGASVKVVFTYTPQSSEVLNAAGQVVSSLHNPTLAMAGINFAQGPDGQFRVISLGESNPPGGVAAFEES